MNLTFSTILRPGFLTPQDQFYLTIITALALTDYLAGKTDRPVSIKWPNDILVHGKKISGILIENQVQGSRLIASVAGIGLNINQENFRHKTATSLKLIIKRKTDLSQALCELLGCIEARYLQLQQQQQVELREEYLRRLYWRNERHHFLADSVTFSGIILGIDKTGKLEVETDEGLKRFDIKMISFIE
jgi:BirA family biotin operon repressor/biotin-[acetyl-CoA-carboxylase] ligase